MGRENVSKCKLCDEKDIEIKRILDSYIKEKKLYWRVIAIMGGVVLLTAFLGNDGVQIIIDIVRGFVE